MTKKIMRSISSLDINQIDRIIEMAWEDKTPFEAIKFQFEISESEVINLMRNNLKIILLKCGESVLIVE